MKRAIFILGFVLTIILSITLKLCCPKEDNLDLVANFDSSKFFAQAVFKPNIELEKDVRITDYFDFMDSIVAKYDAITHYKLTEHHLVRANPWIIDTLSNTDYYRMKKRDSFVYDQQRLIALPKGAILQIPDAAKTEELSRKFSQTRIDINIPEYRLRIFEDKLLLYNFPIRVGINEEKYLQTSGRVEDLKTKTGKGFIVGFDRYPKYINPADGQQYYLTQRDDDKLTKLPQIPFIETQINGFRHGQLIHPTTNPKTLGKAYSNGCIGMRESDVWLLYYHAPVGTKIEIRYDLEVVDTLGQAINLEDIYDYKIKE